VGTVVNASVDARSAPAERRISITDGRTHPEEIDHPVIIPGEANAGSHLQRRWLGRAASSSAGVADVHTWQT
jgi:hypothetical protein